MKYPIYRLSSRQRNEVYFRRQPLCVAIPLDSRLRKSCANDPEVWAGRFLPDMRQTVKFAEVGSVDVIRPFRTASPKSLPEALGHIAGDWDCTDKWQHVIHTSVLIAWLCNGELKHRSAKPQWPDDVLIDGVAVFCRNGEAT
ncbi:MAG: hypothetical protein JSS02_12805 [Planctomycetes bacterium]|nr:hypothetical protein [Planctomycetota bacterium]